MADVRIAGKDQPYQVVLIGDPTTGSAGGSKPSSGSLSIVPANDLGSQSVISSGDYPEGATPVNASSGSVANAVAAAAIPAVVGKVSYLAGFSVTGAGATVGVVVLVAVTGLVGGPMTFPLVVSAGALVMNQGLSFSFPKGLPAAAANTPITVSCPALGAGNTANATNVWGYQR